ncbi:unnamed protein product [marine sediment metagenome]|uniref:Uncharacterized protein n=1 Tax=marine sediment metagenome TaxID=412755 RepID=X1MA80_9ZZZZ
MVELYNLLEKIRIEAERQIRRELSGLGGLIKAPIYNTFMPLIVNVQSERESYHFIFQRGRAVSLYDGSHKNPDVTISGNHTELIYLLQRKDRNRFIMDEKTGKIEIISHTSKGTKAIAKIREMFS